MVRTPLLRGITSNGGPKSLRSTILNCPRVKRSIYPYLLNGEGVIAHRPIPPEIFGHLDGKEGIDPFAI